MVIITDAVKTSQTRENNEFCDGVGTLPFIRS